MPTKSPAQERLMQAAAHTKGGYGGVPQSVGEEFVGKDAKIKAAGVAFVTEDGSILLLKRSGASDHPGAWCLPGGHVEPGEKVEEAARRECFEEIGTLPRWDLAPIHRATNEDGVDFTTFAQGVEEKFVPTLNEEHEAHRWFDLGALPEDVHPGIAAMLADVEIAQDAEMAYDRAIMAGTPWRECLAFDRSAATVRHIDADGRMHVAVSNISKATINPYLGREIPQGRALGLQPDKVYKLLRHPDELAKGAHTFNNIPLLDEHVPVDAEDHKPEHVVGSTGTDASYEHPHLKNSLVIWAGRGIKSVQSNKKKELSSAYRYRADMTPGEHEGQKYDGVMRDIVGNHVALVEEGRAGSDVVVGDSVNPYIQEKFAMSKKNRLSLTAGIAQGALMTFLAPKMAMDSKIDLGPILKGVTHKNFKTRRAGITSAIGKIELAQDATIDGLEKVLDMIECAPGAEDEEKPETEPGNGKAAMDEDDMDEDVDGAEDEDETDEQKAARLKKAEDKKAADKKAKDEAAKTESDKKDEDKKAMDAQIKLATDQAIADERKNQQAIADAKEAVRPYVGSLAMAFDSAGGVYRHALKALGKDVAAVKDDEALPHILSALPVPGGREGDKQVIAMDSKARADFATRFPNVAKIKIAG